MYVILNFPTQNMDFVITRIKKSVILYSTFIWYTLNYDIIFYSAHLSLECILNLGLTTTTNGSKKVRIFEICWVKLIVGSNKKNVPHFHTLVRSFFTFLRKTMNSNGERERVSPILRNAYNCNFSSTPESTSKVSSL